MDILHYLKTHHDSIRTTCESLWQAKAVKERKAQLEALVKATEVYLTLERDFLYPEISGLFAAADSLIEAAETNAANVDKGLKSLVKYASGAGFDAAVFATRLQELQLALTMHFDQEEQNLMPKMRMHIRTEEREDLGQVFADAEAEVLLALTAELEPVSVSRKRA